MSKRIRVHLDLEFAVDSSLDDALVRSTIEARLRELRSSPTACQASLTAAAIRDIELLPDRQNFTVVFFIDGDRAVEYFSEEVVAKDAGEAWKLAVAQAEESGCSSSGYSLDSDDFEKATEIATFRGHGLGNYEAEQRFKMASQPKVADPEPGEPFFIEQDDLTVTLTIQAIECEIGLDTWVVTAVEGGRYAIRSVDDDWHAMPSAEAQVAA